MRSPTKVSAPTVMATTVDPMIATPRAAPSDPNLSKWPTTPTPAGTNRSERWPNKTVVVGAMVFANRGHITQVTNNSSYRK